MDLKENRMLNRLTVKGRMYIINAAILVLFVTMVVFAVNNSNGVKELGIQKTGEVMLEDQKAKIQVANHTAALMLGAAIKEMTDKEARIATIRKLVDKIRYETDKSGYYFVYDGTICVALPPKKELQGKDLVGVKDKNGVMIVQEMRDKAKSGGGFTHYIWPKPGAGDTPKLSYSEMIPGTDMWIGTGVYLDNIETYKANMANDIGAMVSKRTTTMVIVQRPLPPRPTGSSGLASSQTTVRSLVKMPPSGVQTAGKSLVTLTSSNSPSDSRVSVRVTVWA